MKTNLPKPITAPDPAEKNNGWSQFEEWAGSDWFKNGPVTPPVMEPKDIERNGRRNSNSSSNRKLA